MTRGGELTSWVEGEDGQELLPSFQERMEPRDYEQGKGGFVYSFL